MDKKVTSVAKDAHLQEEIYFKKLEAELIKAWRLRDQAAQTTKVKAKP